jgi:uncharacterized membrane protein YfcA
VGRGAGAHGRDAARLSRYPNAASGSAAYLHQRRVDIHSGAVFALCTLPGSVVGVLLADRVSRPAFDPVMGVALCE